MFFFLLFSWYDKTLVAGIIQLCIPTKHGFIFLNSPLLLSCIFFQYLPCPQGTYKLSPYILKWICKWDALQYVLSGELLWRDAGCKGTRRGMWVLVPWSALASNLLDVFAVPGCGTWAVGAAAGQHMHRPTVELQQCTAGEEMSYTAHVEAAAPVLQLNLAHPSTFSAAVVLWPAVALGFQRRCWRHEPQAVRRATGSTRHPCWHEDITPYYVCLLCPPPPCLRSASLCIKITIMRVWDCFPIYKSAKLGDPWMKGAVLQRGILWGISSLPW